MIDTLLGLPTCQGKYHAKLAGSETTGGHRNRHRISDWFDISCRIGKLDYSAAGSQR